MNYLILLLILLLTTPCFAQEQQARMSIGVMGGAAAAAACGGGTSYLLCENFGGGEACGDGVHTNCDLTWTAIGNVATQDFNYNTSPAPLEGSYSLRLAGGVDSVGDGWKHSFTAQDTIHFFFIFNATVRGSGGILSILDGSNNEIMRVVDLNPEFGVYCGTILGYSVPIVAGTTYYIWGDYTRDSDGGSPTASCHLFHSTNTTKGSADITIINGDATAQAAQLRILHYNTTPDTITDKIRVSTSNIGDNPN